LRLRPQHRFHDGLRSFGRTSSGHSMKARIELARAAKRSRFSSSAGSAATGACRIFTRVLRFAARSAASGNASMHADATNFGWLFFTLHPLIAAYGDHWRQ
jgi:hypothetical protein